MRCPSAQFHAGLGAVHNTYCPRNHSPTDNFMVQEMKELLSSQWASGALSEIRLRLFAIEYDGWHTAWLSGAERSVDPTS